MGRGGSTEKSLDGTCVPETPNYRHKWVSELFIQVALLICKKKSMQQIKYFWRYKQAVKSSHSNSPETC